MRASLLRFGVAALAVCAAVMMINVNMRAGGGQEGPAAPSDGPESPQGEAEADKPPTVRAHNVADLISLSRECAYEGSVRLVTEEWYEPSDLGIFEPPEGLFPAPPRRRRAHPRLIEGEDLFEAIAEVLGDGAWEQGRVKLLGHLVVATQPPAGHEKIQKLLDALRKELLGVPTVTVEARWVRLTAEQLEQVQGARKGQPGPPRIGPEVLKAATEVARGDISCLDRRTVHLITGRGESIISDAEPVVSECVSAPDPVVTRVLWGAALEVTPVLADDGRSATVGLASVVSRRRGMRQSSVPMSVAASQPAAAAEVKIDHPDFEVDGFATTVRLPLGLPVLVAGAAGGKDADSKGVHLVLTVTADAPAKKP